MSESADQDDSSDIIFMDHRGYLGNAIATSTGDTVTVTSTQGLLVGTVIIADGVAGGDYVRITDIPSNRQFVTSRDLNLNGAQRIYYYSDKGLANRAYDNFCLKTIGAEMAVTASNGDTYLTLNTIEGMAVNMVVQSSPFIPFDPDNSIITKIIEINPTGYPANTIRINRALAHPTNKDMVVGITLVVCPSDTTLNKEACVIPLNTAPPFVGTIDGLRTTDGNGGTKDLEVDNVNGVLRVVKVTVENAGTITELTPGATNNYDRTIPIQCAGVDFKILGTTS